MSDSGSAQAYRSRVLEALSSLLDHPASLAETRRRITFAARDVVSGVDEASLTVRTLRTNHFETAAATSRRVLDLDSAQYRLGEGPCIDAVTVQDLVVVGDLATAGRWPKFAAKALDFGFRSQMAARLRGDGVVVGLNLYAERPRVFAEPLDSVRTLARIARVVLAYAGENANLRAAIDSRTVIGEAVGIIMERYQLDERRGFTYLVRISQQTNTKVSVLAQRIVRGRDDPEPDADRQADRKSPTEQA